MIDGVLLDTNSLLWFRNSVLIKPAAFAALNFAQQSNTLFASSISVWELSFAERKKDLLRRPGLRGMTSRQWFDDAVQRLRVSVIAIDTAIASEAAEIAPSMARATPATAS